MGKKYKDIEIGDIYGRWTVIGEGGESRKYWLCQCSCENKTTKEVRADGLKNGKSKSCGCLQRELIAITGFKNRKYNKMSIGDKYGEWSIIAKGKTKGNKNYWICKCSCEYETIKEIREDGLLNGTSSACRKCGHKKYLTGQQFGYLTVIRLNKDKKSGYTHTFYDVKCKCGTEFTVRSDSLTCGVTTSCGCKQQEYEDLTGQKFGLLTVLGYVERFSYSDIKDYKTSVNIWKCECNCGNIINVRQGDLLREHTYSCGCSQRSRGEIKIADNLTQWNIKYIEQYRFDDCKYKNPLPFDFVLLDENNKVCCAIEYDGEFHYNSIKWGDMTQEEADENLRTTHIRDNIKSEYCLINNIPTFSIVRVK